MNAPAEGLSKIVRSESPRLAALRDALANTIERVGNIIDLETESLRQFQAIDLGNFNHQKSHGLLELTRAMRAIPPEALDREIAENLARLREKLERNLETLSIHLKAVRQVSALIARAIEDDNSDGTYSASLSRAGR
ncbi:MAG: flagellar protein FlgN [Methylovirgula sp.]